MNYCFRLFFYWLKKSFRFLFVVYTKKNSLLNRSDPQVVFPTHMSPVTTYTWLLWFLWGFFPFIYFKFNSHFLNCYCLVSILLPFSFQFLMFFFFSLLSLFNFFLFYVVVVFFTYCRFIDFLRRYFRFILLRVIYTNAL